MSPTTPVERQSGCQTCVTGGRKGSCARLRCYCGHSDCWAYSSFVPLEKATPGASTAPAQDAKAAARREIIRQAWDNREEDTWIDKV